MDRKRLKGGMAVGGNGQPRYLYSPDSRLCGISDVGSTRDQNQDAFYISDDASLLVVADGMGGHRAGELASKLAVEAVVDVINKWINGDVNEKESSSAETALLEGFKEAQKEVIQVGSDNPKCEGMGTTLTACLRHLNQFVVCHIGDSRAYLILEQSQIMQITSDHSLVEQMVQSGQVTREKARVHPKRGMVLQAIGSTEQIEPDVYYVELAPGDSLMLCSDGLWESLSEKKIREIACEQTGAEQRAKNLVDSAIQSNTKDNVTVVLYDHVI